jgi:phospholipid/cholesterol/gamma-HCH transport system permease protein
MQDGDAGFEIRRQGDGLVLQAAGSWLVAAASKLDRGLRRLDEVAAGSRLRIDLAGVERLDTAGAWLVLRTRRKLEQRGVATSLENVAPAFAPLLDQVAKRAEPPVAVEEPRGLVAELRAGLAGIGGRAVEAGVAVRELLGFFGLVVVAIGRSLLRPGRIRVVALVAQMDRTGVSALPIVGLLSFLIGVVISYQGADQLRRFGAEVFAVNLLGISILRELGVLLTAIILAGRSGSAFTAEIGAMQVNEEIDALRTLGLDPIEVLVLPRLAALILTLPLIAAYADLMGLLGGALMSWASLGIPLPLFIRQFHDAVDLWTFLVGIIKAPFFAADIALVGCHAGLSVSRSAESVGRFTTMSVVRSIFLVIVIDAAFSILFSRLGI